MMRPPIRSFVLIADFLDDLQERFRRRKKVEEPVFDEDEELVTA